MEGGEEWLPEAKLGVSGQGKKKGNKRRFSDEQIRLLEMMFEEETKLEPKKKLQAARELGLQPRQVAIWFQNRRARWKSKRLEGEYNVLKANYDALAQSFDSLKKEKQSLLKQVKKLSEMVEKPEKRSSEGSRDCDDDSDDGAGTKSDKTETKPKLSMRDGADFAFSACSVEENSINRIQSFRPEESDMMPIVGEPAGAESSSIAWPEDWADLDSGSFSDQSCCTMEWWDFWV